MSAPRISRKKLLRRMLKNICGVGLFLGDDHEQTAGQRLAYAVEAGLM